MDGRHAAGAPRAEVTPLRAVVWRRHRDNASLECAVLSQLNTGYEITGEIVTAHEGEPLRVTYRLRCRPDWRSRALTVEQRHGLTASTLRLSVGSGGRWRMNGKRVDGLVECTDVDLALRPSTNALPINRLRLAVGETAEITAAWVLFPGLEVVPARQSYERRAERIYRYESRDSGFRADIEVDELGLPIRYQDIWYQGIWERIAERS
ncbi:MAG TPA: putative glycolipid-binding domain-containing protein [bacterium]|nr:putative glycolipid-binding domain-containing protein [bacterium]